jgi:LAGLIDADG DNA endonuclease family
VLTKRGWVAVQDLLAGSDMVMDGTPMVTADQQAIVLASALGDGGFIEKNGIWAGFRWSQAQVREPYAAWKAEALANFAPRRLADGRWRTEFFPVFQDLLQMFPRRAAEDHRYRKLIITPAVLDRLGPLGLAVWLQDDACAERDNGAVLAVRLGATLLDVVEVDAVIEWLVDKFGVNASYNQKQGFFRISKSDLSRLMAVIAPWVRPCCAYKFPAVPTGYGQLDTSWHPHWSTVLSVAPAPYAPSRDGWGVRFCLDVAGTHNFVTQVGVVHNCRGDTDACYRGS